MTFSQVRDPRLRRIEDGRRCGKLVSMFAISRLRARLFTLDLATLLPWLPWLTGAAAFVLYAATAAPSLVRFDDDSLEFQLVGPTLGIAHPTGYPLYTLLGGLWSRVIFPVGNWAWRMNLFSALAGAVAVALVCAIIQRLMRQTVGGSPALAGVTGAAAFALGSVWWSQTTVAEVYALHGLISAAILFVTLGVADRRDQPGQDRSMTWLFLLFGLGMAHHRTTLLLAPGVAVYLLWQIPGLWRPRSVWLRWAAALLLPLLLYGWIPLRASMGVADLNGDYVNSWSGFWFHVLAQGYTGFFQANALTASRSAGEWLTFFVREMGGFYFVLGVAGLLWLVWLGRMARRAAVLLILVGAVNLLFVLAYRVGDPEVFMLPVFLVLAVGVGAGMTWTFSPPSMTLWPNHVAVAMFAVGLVIPGLVLALRPRSMGGPPTIVAVAMAKVDFPPQSRVIGIVGEVTALKYMQQAEGLGRNAIPLAADDPTLRRTLVAEHVAAGHAVFLTRELPGIENEYSFTSLGPLVRVWPRGTAQSGPAQFGAQAQFDDGRLALTGYDLAVAQNAGGPSVAVAFYWQATAPITRTLKLSLRLLGPDGEATGEEAGEAMIVEDRFPLHQAAPTWSWLPGEILRDEHSVPLPINPSTHQPITPLPTTLLVIVYDADSVAEVGTLAPPPPTLFLFSVDRTSCCPGIVSRASDLTLTTYPDEPSKVSCKRVLAAVVKAEKVRSPCSARRSRMAALMVSYLARSMLTPCLAGSGCRVMILSDMVDFLQSFRVSQILKVFAIRPEPGFTSPAGIPMKGRDQLAR